MIRFALNHSYFPSGCAPDVYLPIKSSGQSNRKKPAIICRILAHNAIRRVHPPRGYIKTSFHRCLFRDADLFTKETILLKI